MKTRLILSLIDFVKKSTYLYIIWLDVKLMNRIIIWSLIIFYVILYVRGWPFLWQHQGYDWILSMHMVEDLLGILYSNYMRGKSGWNLFVLKNIWNLTFIISDIHCIQHYNHRIFFSCSMTLCWSYYYVIFRVYFCLA